MLLISLLTVADVARTLNVSQVFVRRLLWSKKLPCCRIGRSVRVAEDDLLRVIREIRIPADPARAMAGALTEDDVRSIVDGDTPTPGAQARRRKGSPGNRNS